MHVTGQGIIEPNFQPGNSKQDSAGVLTPLYPREVLLHERCQLPRTLITQFSTGKPTFRSLCSRIIGTSRESPLCFVQEPKPQFLNYLFERCIFSMYFGRPADSADICTVMILVVCEVFPFLTIEVILRKQSPKEPKARQRSRRKTEK